MNKKYKICIIDDEIIILNLYKEKLSRLNYDVVTYISGKDALENLPSEMPDLILLDVIMPEMDGIKTLEKIRSNKQLNKIPIIFLTNLDDDKIKKEAIEKGALYFLNKAEYLPKNVANLIKEILDVQKVMIK